MRSLRKLRLRVTSLLFKRTLERKLDQEIRLHMEQLAAAYVAEGMTEQDAWLHARREFGPIESLKDECRDARRVNWLYDTAQDLRLGVRSLAHSPAFSITAILTLALGVGVNVALFNVIYAVLLAPLPYRDANRLVHISETHPDFPSYQVAVPDYWDWQKNAKSFEGIAAYTFRLANDLVLTDGAEPEAVQGVQASPNLFPLLGVKPLLGRFYSVDEEKNKSAVILLSESLWRRRYGADPSIIGRKISVIKSPVTVIGIVPQFEAEPSWADVWIPMSYLDPALTSTRRFHVLEVIARLRPDVSVSAAQAEMNTIAAALARSYPLTNGKVGIAVVPFSFWLTGDARPGMVIAWAAVSLVLILACVNVAHLVLVRTLRRTREIAMRAALGADLLRIYRFILAENVVLAFTAGTAGLILAKLTLPWLSHSMPASVSFRDTSLLSPVSIFFAAGAILFSLILFALPALLHSRRIEPSPLIKQSSGFSFAHRRSWFGHSVIAIEIALALTVVTAATLLYRSFAALTAQPTGFDSKNVLAVELPLALDWNGSVSTFEQKIAPALRRVPGVTTVAAVNCGPMMLRGSETSRFTRLFAVAGRTAPSTHDAQMAQVRWITPDYFRTLRIPLKQGRLFSESDIGKPGYIVNETLAKRFFPNENPIGQRLWKGIGGPSPVAVPIFGVVGDVRDLGIDLAPAPTLYELGVTNWMTVLVRSDVPSVSIARAIRAAIRSVSPEDAIARIGPLNDIIQHSIDRSRSVLSLIGMFGVLAAGLAAIGIVGVLTYALNQREKEFAVRFAIGAEPKHIWILVLRMFAFPIIAGIGAGTWLAYMFGYALRSELYKVAPSDPGVLILSSVCLLAAVFVCAAIPISKTARICPASVLRES